MAQILDQWGRPIEKKVLTEEIAAPTIGGTRSPISGYAGDGLNPSRLASILREADAGDPLRYMELAETIEERDLHYAGVLGTRKRSVSQIDISVEAASDDAKDVDMADMVRHWLQRDELAEELFDVLDAIGKGYSFTEIIWDTSEGQWRPQRLEWRDPRWFRPARQNLTTPMLIGENGQEEELPGGKFITAVMRAKSGLPVRSGLARIVSWGWMFKAFANRDWAIFTQTYGQPIRVGKYGPGSTEKDRSALFRAVANIAGDCAAIIPESMMIEFIESKSVGASSDLYEKRVDWIDRQVSKAVLGQTTTTDAISGGHAVSKEHREVQTDIERADAKALSAILNRDLIRIWVDLEYGPQKQYPRLRLARPDTEDLGQLTDSLAKLVPLGLRVQASEIRDKFGLADPDEGAELLAPAARTEPLPPEAPARIALQQERQPAGRAAGLMPDEIIADEAAIMAGPAIGDLVERVRSIVESAGSLKEAEAALERALDRRRGDTDPDLIEAMKQAMLLAWLTAEAAENGRA